MDLYTYTHTPGQAADTPKASAARAMHIIITWQALHLAALAGLDEAVKSNSVQFY
jgi:hypothetical protein